MSIKLIWNDSCSVGNKKLDNQHKRMFDLANSLPEHLGQQLIDRIIMDLYKHTNEHFTLEEQMMQEIGYPKIDEHKELHNDLITKLNNISTQSFNDDQSVFDFKKFIYYWVIDHIINNDRDYFRFARQKQER